MKPGDDRSTKFCSECGKAIIYAADPTPKRIRKFHPDTGKELILHCHTLCRRRFVDGANAVLFRNGD